MKRPLLLLILILFLAFPAGNIPEAHSAGQSKKHQVKSKSSGSKSKHKARPRQKAGSGSRKPVAVVTDTFQDGELRLRSSSALVIEQKSGKVLYAKNIDVTASIASITKLMTAMVTLDAGLPLGEEVVIGQEDVDRLKFTGSRLALGARLTREDLIHLALIASENRAAAALSRAYPGGRHAFVHAMNRKAREIGMSDSCFVDGTGLHSGNRSTAVDLARMVEAACHYPLIREITSTGSYDVSFPGTRVRKNKSGGVQRVKVQHHMAFNNTNGLTRSKDWDIGLSKTGYISEAGHCLVMQARIAEQEVIIVLLDSGGKGVRLGDIMRVRKWLELDHHVAGRQVAQTSS